ncbi:hypothetical protein ABFX02_13G160400 [Erythranthe guttata]
MEISRGFYDDQAFMTCILRVNYQTPKWQKAVRGVLSSSKGVRSFKMDEYGTVEVSGMVDPNLLIKRLGKAGRAAELCWFQFGQCSTNLFLSSNLYYHHHHRSSALAVGDGRFFPFRHGGVHQYYYPQHLYGYGYYGDECRRPPPPATRRRVYSTRGESVECCCIM